MQRTLLSVALALFTSILCIGSAQAGGGTGSNKYSYKGKYASVSYFSQTDCVFTSAYVGAGESVFRQVGKPAASRMVTVYVDVYNACDDTYHFAYGDAPLSSNEFTSDPGKILNMATVHKTLDVCSYDIDGNPVDCGAVAVDLTWTGTGDTYRGMWHGHWFSPGMKVVTRDNSTYRDATVSGSVVDAWGNDYAISSQSYASMSYSNGGSVEIYK